MERVLDTIRSKTGNYFNDHDFAGKDTGFNNDKAIKSFIKTGEYNFMPGIDRDKYDSETDLKEALKRDKKIH